MIRKLLNWLPVDIRPAGWVFIIIVWLVFAAAFNTGINLFYLLAAMLSSFLLVSVFYTWRNLQRMKVRCEAPRAVHRDDPLVIQVRVENHKWLLPACSVRLHSAMHPETSLGHLLKVPGRRAAVASVRETMTRRGVYALPVPVLESSFPFGLINRRRRFPSDQDVIVYPRVVPVRTNAVDQSQGTQFASQNPTADGDEFYGLREYVVGDDLRRIAWRASARLGTWVIREMAQDNARYVILALDTRRMADAPDFEERFEEAVELVASLGISLLRRQYDISIETPEAFLEGGNGTSHERRLLEMLARVQPCDPAAHGDFDNIAKRLSGQRAALVLISPDPKRWGSRVPATSVRYLDPREVVNA
jgi:uncharacterized protein (DUF58 family)